MSTITDTDKTPLKITFVGHVDHGKSTVVGRLLNDMGALPEGKVDAVKATCEKRGVRFEWAFVMDALQAERDQGITIDTATTWFSSKKRDYVIIDAPGHKEFLKNMVTGAAGSDAAILIVDAHEGVREQTRRHGYLLHLLGITQVTAVVNKMDKVEYSQATFDAVKAELVDYLERLGVSPAHVIPASGLEGDNLASRSDKTPWYDGPTVVEALDGFAEPASAAERPLRFPVQDVYKFDDRRIIAGRIESGVLEEGDTLVFAPSGKKARVASIEEWNGRGENWAAGPGASIGITLDEQIFVERGQVAAHPDHRPVETNVIRARVFWLGKEALKVGDKFTLKLNTSEQVTQVVSVEKVIDSGDLSAVSAEEVPTHGVGEVVLWTKNKVALDDFTVHPQTGRFVLADGARILGGGILVGERKSQVQVRATNIYAVDHAVTPESRAVTNGHKGGVVWLTGLSGSGKSTVAIELEKQLHKKGMQVYVLDGDNVRGGLNKDLGFSPEDRAENIRRIGEVANLFADAGMIVVTAFISPYREDRDIARAIRPDGFHEVYIKADLETCESRDPKGLYKKAREGKIPEFTGISAPYEAPENPELVVDTAGQSLDESVAELIGYINEKLSLEEQLAAVA